MPIDTEALRTLSAASDLDLERFRSEHVEARVARALRRSNATGVGELGVMLRRDADAREEFRRSIAISVTGFFRDAEQFAHLEHHLTPLLGAGRLRVWSAGCSNGAELWSMAVVLERLGALDRTRLLGSDLLPENVDRARAGLDGGLLAGHVLPPSARPAFEVRDLINDEPPVGPWHVILCRNVAIYYEPKTRLALQAKLATALAPGGLLLLGRSERLSDAQGLGLQRVAPHLYRKV